MQLTERQERILQSVVESYVDLAHPVPSAAVARAAGLDVSSATVRNEMAVLEELGYIQHLHTSGGRIPTDAGYRYYVERLMASEPLPNAEARTIRHQFHQSHAEIDEWVKLAAAIIANRMHIVGLVTAPRTVAPRLRHFEAVSIQPTVVLLIAVLQDGTVVQEMSSVSSPRTQEDLSAQADRIGAELRGLTAREIELRLPALPAPYAEIAQMVGHLLRRVEEQHADVYHTGLADLFSQPEFLGPRHGETPAMMAERIRHVVEFLQQGIAVERLLAGLSPAQDVQVVIGGGSMQLGLDGYSFVLARYGADADGNGYLGMVGPTRMQYPRAVSLVRYMTHLMTDLIQAY